MIKKLLGVLALSMTCALSVAAEGGYRLETAPNRINDMAALQNGAKLFVNHCLSCHSANSMRYNKLMDIGLTEEEIKRNLLFTGDKVGDLMHIAMTPEDAKNWFGAPPPDLSVIARAKSTTMGPSGVDYVYTFLRTFYRDTSRPSGWDNLVFPSTGMPNVLWQLQGEHSLNVVKTAEGVNEDGSTQWKRTTADYDAQGFSVINTEVLENYTGSASTRTVLTPADASQSAVFDNNVADISNFLGWMAEPGQLLRKQIGVWVLLFLVLFFGVAWRLNAVFWKDVK